MQKPKSMQLFTVQAVSEGSRLSNRMIRNKTMSDPPPEPSSIIKHATNTITTGRQTDGQTDKQTTKNRSWHSAVAPGCSHTTV